MAGYTRVPLSLIHDRKLSPQHKWLVMMVLSLHEEGYPTPPWPLLVSASGISERRLRRIGNDLVRTGHLKEARQDLQKTYVAVAL